MNLVEFLKAVVPPGKLVTARKVERRDAHDKPYISFQHAVSNTYGDMAHAIVNHARSRSDTYFALAAYKQGFHMGPKDKKVLRVRDNVAYLKALWLDIDFKDGYSSPKEAASALRGLGLPAPSILVHSGNGIHAYWPLVDPIPLNEWLLLSNGLKEAAKEAGIHADLACTADACRVLRPPRTYNWKDPDNPKQVQVLYSSGRLFKPSELEITAAAPHSMAASSQVYQEFTGGVGSRGKSEPSYFANIIKHCEVSKHLSDTRGKDSSEPEWVAILQLLKHCEDAELWVHAVSDGHPGYEAQATEQKWDQRVENTAGPTLCKTFEDYYPEFCKRCPRHTHISSPIQVGYEDTKAMGAMPMGWRVKDGVTEQRRADKEGNWEWEKVINYAFSNLRTSRSTLDGRVEHKIDTDVIKDITLPGAYLGSSHDLSRHMADVGVPLPGKQLGAFVQLMSTWLKDLQNAKHVTEVTNQLGWIMKEDKYIGFASCTTAYYADGRVREGVRSAKEFANVAKYYEPVGSLDKWKEVAAFLAEQDNPAFTAVIAAAFAAPICKFNGISGALLAIVSPESGLGKTSAMKCSQAVWGSPTHGMNAIDDTRLSVARKIGFLNNLPAYWDEIRGEQNTEDFLQLAFQITQGKEKTRLDQSATLREIHTWETMLIVASNDSIFDSMGRFSIGSDAGVARTFEIIVDPYEADVSKSKVAMLFEQLNTNYGYAGAEYAQYLALNSGAIRERIMEIRQRLEESQHERDAERFWFAIIASLIVGAEIAKKLGLVDINIRTLTGFLVQNLNRLRGRGVESMRSSDPNEILATYIQMHQDRTLTVDRFPTGKNYLPQILIPPRSEKLILHIARGDQLARFSKVDFLNWLSSRNMNSFSVINKFKKELKAVERKCQLGVGTKYQIPKRQLVIEVPVSYDDSAEDILDD